MSDTNIEEQVFQFAFVVEGDVGFVVWVGPNEDQLKQLNCLRNNPTITEVGLGDDNRIKFDFANDGVVNFSLRPYNTEEFQRQIACLRSNPTIIEVEMPSSVRHGWTYDGTTFSPPV
jgi:hypothetical protein